MKSPDELTAIRNATLLPGIGPVDRPGPIDLRLEHGRIRDIAAPTAAPVRSDEIDATGLLLLPGLINGHTHSHEALYRGRYPKLPLEEWMHFVRPPLPLPLSPHDVYLRTLLAALDALRGGATSVVDDVGVPSMQPEHLEAIAQAYRDAGLRAWVAPTMFDRSFVQSVPDVEEEVAPGVIAEILALPRADPDAAIEQLEQRLRPREDPRDTVRFAVAASAPQRCTDEYLRALHALALRYAAPLISHVNETRLQAVTAQLLYGQTMTEHLDSLGVLGPQLSMIHAIWLTDTDLDLVCARDATLQHNPTSNLRLGSGVAPITRWLRLGIRATLATDGVGSTVSASMLDALRVGALVASLHGSPAEWPSARTLLAMATEHAAHALGRGDDLGRLDVGFRADLIGLRLDTLALTPANDPVRQVVYDPAPTVDLTVIDGRAVVVDGRHQLVDTSDLLAQVRRLHRRLLPTMQAGDRYVAEHLSPALRRIHARARAQPLPDEPTAARWEPALPS